jgi:hypothetical protein
MHVGNTLSLGAMPRQSCCGWALAASTTGRGVPGDICTRARHQRRCYARSLEWDEIGSTRRTGREPVCPPTLTGPSTHCDDPWVWVISLPSTS